MKGFVAKLSAIVFIAACAMNTWATAGTKRSTSAIVAFKKDNPCPATGATKGPCKGYVIDHIKALACGGPDHQSNMQWQTVADAKAKDKWERKECGK